MKSERVRDGWRNTIGLLGGFEGSFEIGVCKLTVITICPIGRLPPAVLSYMNASRQLGSPKIGMH